MSDKIKVSYLAIGAYASFVVVSTLLVGLLPPLVNRPYCEDTKVAYANDFLSNEIEHHDVKVKRDVEHVLELNTGGGMSLAEKKRQVEEKHPGLLAQSRILKMKNIKPRGDFDYCTEINAPNPDTRYPWYSRRLPDTIRPVNYNIEMVMPGWDLEVYDGFINIKIEVIEPTNWILLHSKAEIDDLQYIKNKRGEEVGIDCVGIYLLYDYYIIKTKQQLNPSDGPYNINILFIGFLPEIDSGIFKIEFDKNLNGDKSQMVASKFEPLNAREAYPCFDEPRFKATYDIKLIHPPNTIALSNTPVKGQVKIIDGFSVETEFEQTPPMPSYLMGYLVFDKDDFRSQTKKSAKNIEINFWARNVMFDEDLVRAPHQLAVDIFDSLSDMFDRVPGSLPPKIDIFAIPEYTINAVPHFGLPVFRENEILFNLDHASERDAQRIGLLIAKNLAEFWFGNFATFGWWDELWLQEGLSDYVKYEALSRARPDWNVKNQFITEELVTTLLADAYPSSHPVQKPINSPNEIDEYFDYVETSKVVGILRMIEEVESLAKIEDALVAYLNEHKWGFADINVFYQKLGNVNKWSAKSFFDRWILQPNYPLLDITLVNGPNNQQSLKVKQSRSLNSEYSLFLDDLLYPSPFNFTWFVPLHCSFGTGDTNSDQAHEQSFYIDTLESSNAITSIGKKYTWVHCNRKFTGYFGLNYDDSNWEALSRVLKAENNELLPEDCSVIIHNLFLNGYTERLSYNVVADTLLYLENESDYLPWRTTYHHLNNMLSVLEYRRSFFQVAVYFSNILRKLETKMNWWEPSGIHVEELMKETIAELACKLQDSKSLRKTEELWTTAFSGLLEGNRYNRSVLPPYIREIIFDYHIQNTYNVEDWSLLQFEYYFLNDPIEKRRFLEALSFSKLPWQLSKFFVEEEKNGVFDILGFFDEVRVLSRNPLGRELAWDYLRINYNSIFETYGEEDPRLGRMLLDIVRTFENEFLYHELLEFAVLTESGASINARFLALEIVLTNIGWLNDKEEEIMEAFLSSNNKAKTNVSIDKKSQFKFTPVSKKNKLEKMTELVSKTKQKIQNYLDKHPKAYGELIKARQI